MSAPPPFPPSWWRGGRKGAEDPLLCPGPGRCLYREELVPQRGDCPSQEASCQGPKGCQHHFTCCPHHNPSGQCGVLDVDLGEHRGGGHGRPFQIAHPVWPHPVHHSSISCFWKSLCYLISNSPAVPWSPPGRTPHIWAPGLCPVLFPWKMGLLGLRSLLPRPIPRPFLGLHPYHVQPSMLPNQGRQGKSAEGARRQGVVCVEGCSVLPVPQRGGRRVEAGPEDPQEDGA